MIQILPSFLMSSWMVLAIASRDYADKATGGRAAKVGPGRSCRH
jgi:hypothetical protein